MQLLAVSVTWYSSAALSFVSHERDSSLRARQKARMLSECTRLDPQRSVARTSV